MNGQGRPQSCASYCFLLSSRAQTFTSKLNQITKVHLPKGSSNTRTAMISQAGHGCVVLHSGILAELAGDTI